MYNIDSNRWFPLTLRATKQVSSKQLQNYSDDPDPENKGAHKKSNFRSDVIRKPSSRFNTMMAVVKSNLYLYGGILEHGTKDVTLGDFWCISLDKMNEWTLLLEDEKLNLLLTEDAELSSDESEGSSDEDDSDDEDSDEDDNLKPVEPFLGPVTQNMIPSIDPNFDFGTPIIITEDEQTIEPENKKYIPLAEETQREFYSRTSSWWEQQAYEHFQVTGKELRKHAFELCKSVFEEWQPKLEVERELYRLNEIELLDRKECVDDSPGNDLDYLKRLLGRNRR